MGFRVSREDDRGPWYLGESKLKIPTDRIVQLGDKSNFWPSNAQLNGPEWPLRPMFQKYFMIMGLISIVPKAISLRSDCSLRAVFQKCGIWCSRNLTEKMEAFLGALFACQKY